MDRACDPMLMPIQSYPFLDAIRIEAVPS